MKRISLNANILKLIAIVAMALDHVGGLFIPETHVLWFVCRFIGRVTAPVMCYMIAEGYQYTSNRRKYLGRLVAFAVISHIPFALCMGFSLSPLAATSVIWSLAMGLLALMIVKEKKLHWILRLGGLGLCCLLAYTANWNYVAVLWVVLFGLFCGDRKKQMIAFAAVGLLCHMGQQFAPLITGVVTLAQFGNWYQFGVFMAIPLLLCFDGTLGRKSKFISYFFYWFYPLHMLVLYVLKHFVFR